MGTGSYDGDKFKFKEFYFCTNPEAFANSHFPVDDKWQLLSNVLTLKEFVESTLIYDGFYEIGFETLSPNLSILNVEEKSKITLTYDESITNINYLQGNTYEEKYNTCITSKKNGQFEVSFVTNQVGNYQLIISGGLYNINLFRLVEFQKNSTKESKNSSFLPNNILF